MTLNLFKDRMIVKGLPIPEHFVSLVEQGAFKRDRGSWPLAEGRDAYGNKFESELGQVYNSAEEIAAASERLHEDFPFEPDTEPDEYAHFPGFIPYVNDFSRILEFAISADGSPFCFDYRLDLMNPSIIWWDDTYWRRVAPSFSQFVSLFKF